jgi:hypothetical protein
MQEVDLKRELEKLRYVCDHRAHTVRRLRRQLERDRRRVVELEHAVRNLGS